MATVMDWSRLRQIGRLVRWEKRLVARFVATAIGRALAQMLVLFLMRDFLAGVLREPVGIAGWMSGFLGAEMTLWATAGLLLLAYVAASLFNYDNQVSQQRLVKVLELGLMERLIRHLLTLSVPFFDREREGDIVQAVRNDISQMRMVVISGANLLLEGVTAVALIVVAVQLSPVLALWAFVVLPVAAFPILKIAKRTLARSYRVRETGYVLFDVILQIVRGMRIIKAYQGEEREARLTATKARAYFEELIRTVRVRELATIVHESLAGLGIVLVIVVGGLKVMTGSLGWPELLTFVMAVRAVHGPLNNLSLNFVRMQEYGAAMARIDALLRERPEVSDRPGAVPLPAAPQLIALERVGFGYRERRALEDVALEVRAGETIGIAGPSGSGKSTLINLIARFYDPSSGSVRFDGRDIREFRLADVYNKIAVVTQEPFLFSTSIRENIRCGRIGASDGDVELAARAAYIHEEILDLPEGYETVVGAGGQGLSGGQKQRLNVARALLKNAPILLLDEATSSLDSVAEAQVQRAIDRLMAGRTTFVVAHRLTTLRNADRIVVLDRGRCVGFGSHRELLDDCAVYRQLWEAQRVWSTDAVRSATATDINEEPSGTATRAGMRSGGEVA